MKPIRQMNRILCATPSSKRARRRALMVSLLGIGLFAIHAVSQSAIAATISAGYSHTCSVTASGAVRCWGHNYWGELGIGVYENRDISMPAEVVGLDVPVSAISLGSNRSCALTTSGGVKCWGNNSEGQFGDGTSDSSASPVNALGLTSGVVAISTSPLHTCAVMESGGVKCWGSNYLGELGDGTNTQRLVPTDVQGLVSGVVAVSASTHYTCALTDVGGVKCWGSNRSGELGDGTLISSVVPVDVIGLSEPVVAIQGSCALSASGGVKCWGSHQAAPVDLSGWTTDVRAFAVGHGTSCALLVDGRVQCRGVNELGQLGNGTSFPSDLPVDVLGLPLDIVEIISGYEHSCAKSVSGQIRCWGNNLFGQLGDGKSMRRPDPVAVVGLDLDVAHISSGRFHNCALNVDSIVKCWGSNNWWPAGNVGDVQSPVPVEVAGLDFWPDVANGLSGGSDANTSCLVTDRGSAHCWGGVGFLDPAELPGERSDIVVIANGREHLCLLTNNGGVECLGRNNAGQLGNGTAEDSSLPVQVIGLATGVTSIVAGSQHTCALLDTGVVKCWGVNGWASLGDGTQETRFVPVEVVGLNAPIASITAGFWHTCAITVNKVSPGIKEPTNTMKCWGRNSSGQLGEGSLTPIMAVVDVDLPPWVEVTAMSAGDEHTCASLRDIGVMCWGNNYYGQLGSGDFEHSAAPMSVVDLPAPVTSLRSGHLHTCALLETGATKCWGYNQNGQLGNGEAGPLTAQSVLGTPFDDRIFASEFED